MTAIYTAIKCKRHWQIHFQIQMTHKKITICILENEFENVVYKMTAVSFMSQCVRTKNCCHFQDDIQITCRLQNGGHVISVSICKNKENCCHFQDDIVKFIFCVVVLSKQISSMCFQIQNKNLLHYLTFPH